MIMGGLGPKCNRYYIAYELIRERKQHNMSLDYMKLQNGSDIRGISVEGVPNEEVNLSCEESIRIGTGFVKWLSEKTGKTNVNC